MRQGLLAAAFAVASALITKGAWLVSPAAGLIVAGIAIAVLAWLFLGDV